MKTLTLQIIALISASVALTGCSSTKPAAVSVESGLHQVGRGLASIKLGELEVLTNKVFNGQKAFDVGLYATDFSFVFNVTKSKSDSNNLYIEADAAVPQSPVSGKAGDSYTTTSSSARGNQIVINFASPYFTTTTTTTTNKTGSGSNVVTTVETKVVRTVTDPQTLDSYLAILKKYNVSPAGIE